MQADFEDYEAYEELPEEVDEEDPAFLQAKEAVAELFDASPAEVFYGRQLEVRMESKFFHWITNRAARKLVEEGGIRAEWVERSAGLRLRFYFSRRCRYWKRKAARAAAMVERYANEGFSKAVGLHAETMFTAALANIGFVCTGSDIRALGGREWTQTDHDLDRVFERDGIAYGAEIKNTLDYIPRVELRLKLQMCGELGLRPLFILRSAPKSYIFEDVYPTGGYVLVFGTQLYPFGQEEFAREVRERFGLPVGCPARVPQGRLDTFLKWQKKSLGM